MTFLTLPVVGLYFSLKDRHVVVNWLLTCAVGIVAPLVYANAVMASMIGMREWRVFGLLPNLLVGVYGALGAGMAVLLARDLSRRNFVAPRGASS
jgi:hypothetical protein